MLRLIGSKIGISLRFDPSVSESGNIIIPDIAKNRSDQGTVKFVGPKVKDIQVGDYVLFGAYDGTNVQLEDDYIAIMDEKVVKCKLDNPRKEVSGLYFKDKNGEYFPADYSIASDLLHEANVKHYEELNLTSKVGKNWRDRHREEAKKDFEIIGIDYNSTD